MSYKATDKSGWVNIYVDERVVVDGGYRYKTLDSTRQPLVPRIGEKMSFGGGGGQWLVVDVSWSVPMRGSMADSQGEPAHVKLIVEESPGLYVDEVEAIEEDE